jgi:hypothetical protein
LLPNKIQKEKDKKEKKETLLLLSACEWRRQEKRHLYFWGLTYNGLKFQSHGSCFQIVFINSRVFVFYYYNFSFYFKIKKIKEMGVCVSRTPVSKNAKHEPSPEPAKLKNVAGSMSRQ